MSGWTINILVWLNTLIKCLQFAESCQNWVSSPTFKWLIGWDVSSLYKFWYFPFILVLHKAVDTLILKLLSQNKTDSHWLSQVSSCDNQGNKDITIWKYLHRYLDLLFSDGYWDAHCTNIVSMQNGLGLNFTNYLKDFQDMSEPQMCCCLYWSWWKYKVVGTWHFL